MCFFLHAGAFKADLFRYCVLLIRGGVYSDMDVLLQTNLDEAIANDVGFMTPLDNVRLRRLKLLCECYVKYENASNYPSAAT